jgi:hypothetical protein
MHASAAVNSAAQASSEANPNRTRRFNNFMLPPPPETTMSDLLLIQIRRAPRHLFFFVLFWQAQSTFEAERRKALAATPTLHTASYSPSYQAFSTNAPTPPVDAVVTQLALIAETPRETRGQQHE